MPNKNSLLWIMLISTFFQCCISSDTIAQNQTFSDGDVLVSSGSSFAFGFFSPGNSKNRYLGIWYNKDSENPVVWVANRDNPIINGTTAILSLESSGNLVLREQSKNAVLWTTNISVSSSSKSSHFVQLLETGNLILQEGDQNSGIFLWKSFDYPSNSYLPHMKLGVNRTSGLLWSITSWKSQDDPGTGDFRHSIDLNGIPQLFLYKNTEKIWRAGPYNGMRLSGTPDMTTTFIFNHTYIENDEEISLSYGMLDPSIFSKVAVNESGIIERLTWQEGQKNWVKFWSYPRDRCDDYNHCGSNSNCDIYKVSEFECECLPGYEPKVQSEWFLRDATNGCVRKSGEPTCGSGTTNADPGFVNFTAGKVPDTTNAVANKNWGMKECADLCLGNCSCTAYASANISNGGGGCITWYGDLIDMRQFSDAGQNVYIKVSASELAKYMKKLKGSNSNKLLIILLPVAIGALLLVFAILVVLWKQKAILSKGQNPPRIQPRKTKYGTPKQKIPKNRENCSFPNKVSKFTGKIRKLVSNISNHEVSSYGGTSRTEEIDENGDLPVFDLKAIILATNSFASENKVGEGGFGSVYKGQLQNGREVAIKRLSKCSGQGLEEFRNEVTVIARLQHRNLVKLLGCCIEKEEKMLVYEYLPNKGLDNFIFDKESGALLDWQKRLDIIVGIARGIVYLHRDSRLRIIHRDLKASNVLLGANMEPKISDFGMARIFNANQMEAKTHRVVGTYGYMSPEYAMQGLFSEKSDVYSYGVILLEIMSGRRNNSYFNENTVNLPTYVWELWKEGNTMEIVDPAMAESFDHDEAARCIQIGLLCVQEHATDRPTMHEVLSMLCNQTSIPSASPKQPAFVIRKATPVKVYVPDSSSAYLRVLVEDDMTFTVLHPR